MTIFKLWNTFKETLIFILFYIQRSSPRKNRANEIGFYDANAQNRHEGNLIIARKTFSVLYTISHLYI